MPSKVDGKTVIKCSCGHEEVKEDAAQLTEKIESEGQELAIVEEDEDTRLPLTEAECPVCKHRKAYWWEVQTRAADEPPTKFLKCEKCKKIWRDYS